MSKIFPKHSQGGATLLMAVLMTSVVLAVGFGIYQRTYKSLLFSSFLKQSQIAFASADSGLECVMYLDLHPGLNTCFGGIVDIDSWPTVESAGSKNFEFEPPSGGCAKVTITKPGQTFGSITYGTLIESRGYNDGCDSQNPRRVERGLKINY